MKKKQIALLLASAMAAISLVGCGQEASTPNQESGNVAVETTETTVEEVKNFNEEGYPIVNEEITLKVLLGIRDADNMCDPDDMPAVQRLEELTGINLEWEVVKSADWSTKLNLMFASGEYPDIILSSHNALDYEEYGVTQKVLVPLDELIDNYLPSYTERIAMEESDPTVNLVASDGQTYSVGYLNGGGKFINHHFFINQKWLDALNLPMPTDLESLTDTLRKFKGVDFNSNGVADEIPLVTYVGDDDVYAAPTFLSLFGVPYNGESMLYIDNNKKVQLVPAQEGFRECMEWFNMCYKEGLLDVEVFTQDVPTFVSKINNVNAGFVSSYNPMSNWKGTAWDAYSVYVPDETAMVQRGADFAQAAAYITVANEHPEATMRLFEAMLDKETQWCMYFGEETNVEKTEGWKYNDAGLIETWRTDDHVNPTVVDRLGVCSLFFAPGEYFNSVYANPGSTEAKIQLVKTYLNAGVTQDYSYKLFSLVKLDAAQNEKRALIETEIKNAVLESMVTFIKDGVTDESWNAFQKVLENMKANEYIEMYQNGIDALDIE